MNIDQKLVNKKSRICEIRDFLRIDLMINQPISPANLNFRYNKR